MESTPNRLYPNLHGNGNATHTPLVGGEVKQSAYEPPFPVWKQRLVEVSGRVVKIAGLLLLLLVTSLNADRHATCVYYTGELVPGPQRGRGLCDGPALAKTLAKFWIDRAMWGVFATIAEVRPDKDHCTTVLADITNAEHMERYRELLAEGFTLTLTNADAEDMARRHASLTRPAVMAHEVLRDNRRKQRANSRHGERDGARGSKREEKLAERNRVRISLGKATRAPKDALSEGGKPVLPESPVDDGPHSMNICYHGGYVSRVFGSEFAMEWIGIFIISVLLFGSAFLNYTMFRVVYALAICAVAFIVGYNPAMIVVFLAWGAGELLQHFVGRKLGMKPERRDISLSI